MLRVDGSPWLVHDTSRGGTVGTAVHRKTLNKLSLQHDRLCHAIQNHAALSNVRIFMISIVQR